MSLLHGGKAGADRVRQICDRAHRIIAAGIEALADKDGPCHCRYPDGRPKYVNTSNKPVHLCYRRNEA